MKSFIAQESKFMAICDIESTVVGSLLILLLVICCVKGTSVK